MGCAGRGQTETVEIQLKLARGEAFYYAFSASGQAMTQIAGMSGTSTFQLDGREALRALDVSDDGTMLVEWVLEEARQSSGPGRNEELLYAPVTLKVRGDGKVVERQSGAYESDDFPFGLPGRPVRIEETWTREERITESGLKGQIVQTFTVAAVERSGDGRIARITQRTEGRVTGSEAGATPGSQIRVNGVIRGSGEILWALEQGRLLRQADDLSIDTQIDASAQGQSVRLTMSIRSKTRKELLAADRVTVPAVAADLLITPGKGIGTFTLDLPVEDLSTRLGSPTSRSADLGLRAAAVSWPDGLVGYVDAADQTKLIGLEIADRRYRTERGIGFGSSQGAVLLAYGLAPVRLDITIPNLGGVRMLIYDDQGIAFAVTSDQAHAGAGPRHAPLGSVDWITVFPPGSAGKIFPLP